MKAADAYSFLKAGFESDRLAQAYIVVGAIRGEAGELVDNVLKLLFCDSDQSGCGSCRGCRCAADHSHPDLQWVEPQKKSRAISVEQMRALEHSIFLTSFEGGWKACVICGADRMTDQAANAFLKTLEEPPDKTVCFLLTDSAQSLLPTIISRCQKVMVSERGQGLIDEWQDRLLDVLTGQGGGGVVMGFGNGARMQRFLKDVKDVAEAEVAETTEEDSRESDKDTLEARVNARYREMRAQILRFVLDWYRDIMLLACGSEPGNIYNDKHLATLTERASALGLLRARRNVEIIEEMNAQFERNMPEGAVISHTFSRLS